MWFEWIEEGIKTPMGRTRNVKGASSVWGEFRGGLQGKMSECETVLDKQVAL